MQIAIQKLGHWRYYNMEPPQLAVNGKDGLSAMREFRPDIVFVDMNMPVMDGASFLMKASQEFPDSQYIVVSGYDQFAYAQQAIRYGACEYLLKPVVEEELNTAIEKQSFGSTRTLYFNKTRIPERKSLPKKPYVSSKNISTATTARISRLPCLQRNIISPSNI